MMRNLLRRAMAKEGYQVVDVTDGDSAIAAYKTFQPAVVLLDAMMPGMNTPVVPNFVRCGLF